MRIYAWQSLLQPDGYVNDILTALDSWVEPVNWLAGKPITVILGLVYGYIPFMILPLFGSLDRINQSLLEAGRDLGASPFADVPPGHPAAVEAGDPGGLVIVSLPMFGDYYTNDLLGTTKTSMFGNLIDNAVTQAGRGPGGRLARAHPDGDRDRPDALLPARDQARGGGTMSEMERRSHRSTAATAHPTQGWFREPVAEALRSSRASRSATCCGRSLPVVIAVIFSFNAGRSRSTWQGFSLRWWTRRPVRLAVARPGAARPRCCRPSSSRSSPSLVAVPLGTLVRDRHRPLARPPGRGPRTSRCCSRSSCPRSSSASRCSCCSRNLLKDLVAAGDRGAGARADHASSCRTRSSSCARDCSRSGPSTRKPRWTWAPRPTQAIRRVLLPLLFPAILASVALVVRRHRRRLRHGPLPLGPGRQPSRCR